MRCTIPIALHILFVIVTGNPDAVLAADELWCVGRVYLNLPDAAIFRSETQTYDGISFRLRNLAPGESRGGFVNRRRNEITTAVGAPPLKEYRWSEDMTGTLFIVDPSASNRVYLEGRRVLNGNALIAELSGYRGDSAVLERTILAALQHFHLGRAPDSETPGLCFAGGFLQEPIHITEAVRATIELPNPGARLDVESMVAAPDTAAGAVEFAAKPEAGASNSQLILREGAKTVAGMEGTEVAFAAAGPYGTTLHARFDTVPRSRSASPLEVHLHLVTGPEVGYGPEEMSRRRFLRVWDSVLTSVRAHP